MSDLISREKLKDDIAVLLERNNKLIDEWLANCIDDVIDEQPTVDAVEVVRCKDCVYFHDGRCGIHNNEFGLPERVYEDYFCNYGYRRKNES